MDDLQYRAVQASLAFFGRKVTHYRRGEISGVSFNLPVSGKVPSCRRVVGPNGYPLVSMAWPGDCGECEECGLPEGLVAEIEGLFPVAAE